MSKRTSYRSLQYLIMAALFIVISSCQKEELESIAEQEASPESEGLVKTVLGEKLENPYSVSNMRKALENLKAANPNGRTADEEIEIETTDYYVRFFPRTDEELRLLEIDSLNLYDYPLDYEIDSLGDYYVDPDVNSEDGKWYYTSVPVDYQFPTIEHEILEELFLIEEDSTSETSNGRGSSLNLLYELEDEALKLTGNWEEPVEDAASPNGRRKKNPQGYVRVYDTERRHLVGVENVKIRTRRWFSYGYAWSSSSGYYRINRGYRRDVHYKVFFENSSGFKIRASTISLWKAGHHVGKHNRSGYDINIYTNSRAWRFATVNNAVVKYRRYCNQLGIGLPPSNLRIVASNRSGGGAAPMLKRVWGFYGFTSKSKVVSFLGKVAGLPATILGNTFFRFVLPDIIIKANSGQGTAAVYETTFHELAHASHYNKVGNNYWIKYINYIVTYGAYGKGIGNNAGLCALGEAWGYHMGYRLTLNEFGNTNSRVRLNAFENFDPLETGDKDDDIFSPTNLASSWRGWIPAGIMHDITDTNRDWVRTGFRDEVSGYTHRDLYDALDSYVDTPQEFRDRLLRENSNRDRTDLENLFEAYYWE